MSDTVCSKKIGWVVPAGLILLAASVYVLLFCGKISANITDIAVCFSVIYGGVLLVYANKDAKDRIIPVMWWIVPLVIALINLACMTMQYNLELKIIMLLCSCIPACIVLLLGLFRKVNGADSLGIAITLIVLCPFTFFGTIVPLGWVIVTLSFISGLILWKIKPEYKRGIPYLVPLALSYSVFGVFI